MDMQEYWQRIKAEIDLEIRREVPNGLIFHYDVPEAYLTAIVQAVEGGKRLRGTMACLVSDALGGQRMDVLGRAVALECIHAGTLVQDDVIDNDTTRRGNPAIWTLDDVGKEGAILIGDILWALGMNTMSVFGREDAIVASSAMVKLASGALRELGGTPGDYDKVIRYKTGELFGVSARLGAISAGRAIDFGEIAYHYGVSCGEAFQLADDVGDAISQEKVLMSKASLRIAAAERYAETFPDNEHTDMLKQFPRFITNVMLTEVRR